VNYYIESSNCPKLLQDINGNLAYGAGLIPEVVKIFESDI
jgi:hypothetical protein